MSASLGLVDDEEERFTSGFQRFALVMWQMYSNKNHEFHECHHEDPETGEPRNADCFYLELDDNDETILPCGGEFQEAVALFSSADGYATLIRFLSFLQDILLDVGSTDDEREEAREFVVTTFKMLSAIMHVDRCKLFAGDKFKDVTTPEHRALQDSTTAMQLKHALAGAPMITINLISDDEDDVLKAAFRYFMMLLNGGNEDVQDMVMEAFDESRSSKALLRLREELNRGTAALRQLQQTQVRAVANDVVIQPRGVIHGTWSEPVNKKKFDFINAVIGTTRSLGDVSLQIKSVEDIAEDVNEDEFRWVKDLCEGIQLMAEGAHRDLQDYLREQKTSKDQSVNFVAELCRALAQVHVNVAQGDAEQRDNWLDLVDQMLDSVTELCQGNQTNQQEALDEQIIKVVNFVIAYV